MVDKSDDRAWTLSRIALRLDLNLSGNAMVNGMDQETSELTFTELAAVLRKAEMGWIVDQVFESIAEGKGLQVVKAGSKRKRAELNRSEPTESDTRGNIYRRRLDYSPQERVILLANAFKAFLNDSLAIDKTLTDRYTTISFRPEIPEESERSFEIVAPSTERVSVTQQLLSDIELLIAEVNA